MAGQHTVQGASSVWSSYNTSSSSHTVAQLVRFNVVCKIVSMHYYHWTGTGFQVNASIWDPTLTSGTNSRIGGKTFTNATAAAGTWHEIVFDTPVTLVANKDYMFGWFYANHYTPSGNLPYASTFTGTVNSSPAGVTAIFGQNYYNSYVSEAWTPTSTSSTAPIMRIGIDTNYLPTSPTGVSVAGSVAIGGNPTMSWTHNDPDGNPQSKYQLRWRKL